MPFSAMSMSKNNKVRKSNGKIKKCKTETNRTRLLYRLLFFLFIPIVSMKFITCSSLDALSFLQTELET